MGLEKRKRLEKRKKAMIILCLLGAIAQKALDEEKMKSGALFRKRWDSEYLLQLACNENSFVAEYRVDPKGFDILVEILGPMLEKDNDMAKRSMSKCKSSPISPTSRLGACLIILAGGRVIEAMRTHGMAKSTVSV